MGRRNNVVLMLGHRLRRWPNIKTALRQRFMFIAREDTKNTMMTVHWATLGQCWDPAMCKALNFSDPGIECGLGF